MNRDYQELLRVELDRVTAGEAPTPGLLQRAVQAAAQSQNGSPSKISVVDHTPAVQVAAESRNGSAAKVSELDQAPTVQQTPWKPVLDELPSLQQRTPAAEQFRRLRARLLEYRSGNPLKTLLVSSAMPQEGKSFVTANLAVALSQYRGTRVLLIDGDMRRYSLQNYFGIAHQPGLPEFLAGKRAPNEIMQQPDAGTLAVFPGLANLTVIPGGSMDEHVADLSEDTRFRELIAYASPLFDWIVVDSSPVTLVSDAVNLARHCDGVLLVVRAGMTKYQTAQKALAELQASTLLGVVLNAVEDRPAPSYYGYAVSEASE